MTKFKYVGEDERVIPTLSLVVNHGDIIEAPDNFNVNNFEQTTLTKESE